MQLYVGDDLILQIVLFLEHLVFFVLFRGEGGGCCCFVVVVFMKFYAICAMDTMLLHVVWQCLQCEAPKIDCINGFVEYFNCIWMNGQYRLSQWN